MKAGIKALIPVDALDIKKVREVKKEKHAETGVEYVDKIEEYFVYTPDMTTGQLMPGWNQGQEIRVTTDAISYVHSGMIDAEKRVVIGYLYKAIKPYNQLRMIEDSLVIYRLARAPERRIFYIDVGNLPKLKAEQYLRSVMDKYKHKVVYNQSTGEVEDQKKQLSMLEDFWLPRREGGRGTEINTLPSGQNLGEIEDIEYFRKKLYQSLNIPISRIEGTEQTAFNLGRTSEINRDEIKFSKYITKIRNRFISLFTDLLKIQLILKGIIKEEDWEEIKDGIDYVWTRDSHYVELKENEIYRERFEIMQSMEEYIGKYVSNEWVRKNILRQTDEDIKENKLIVKKPMMKNFLAMMEMVAMTSSFIKNYKNKVSEKTESKLMEAVYYAFDLTDQYGIVRINKAISEASLKYNINEDVLREKINDDSFVLTERKKHE